MGATRTYLLYALGEIALVVIGILIALQINNWNEWRKDRIREKIVLQNLAQNLEKNIDILNEAIIIIENYNQSSEMVVSFFEKKLAYHDSLDRHFFLAILPGLMQGNLTYDGYEFFKNEGFEIVQSESLGKMVIQTFEVAYRSLEQWKATMLNFQPVFIELRHAEFVQYDGKMTPQNTTDLSNNMDVRSAYNMAYTTRKTFLGNLKECKNVSMVALESVTEELTRMDQ